MFDVWTRKGILNDFDFSSIMDPGSDSPPLFDLKYMMGNKPFMALDLLSEEGHSGCLARRYRHELESFTWVLLWATVRRVSVVNGEVEEKWVPPVESWVDSGCIWASKFALPMGGATTFWRGLLDHNSLLSAAPNSLNGLLQMCRRLYDAGSDAEEENEVVVETNGHDLLEMMMEVAGADIPQAIGEDWLNAGVKTHVLREWIK